MIERYAYGYVPQDLIALYSFYLYIMSFANHQFKTITVLVRKIVESDYNPNS